MMLPLRAGECCGDDVLGGSRLLPVTCVDVPGDHGQAHVLGRLHDGGVAGAIGRPEGRQGITADGLRDQLLGAADLGKYAVVIDLGQVGVVLGVVGHGEVGGDRCATAHVRRRPRH